MPFEPVAMPIVERASGMKVTWALLAMCVTLPVVSGCGRSQSRNVEPVVVLTEDGSPFPAALAGRWKSDRHGWEFVIEPDGRIAETVIGLGRVTILPGQTATVMTRTNEQAVFTPGSWVVHYDPTGSMLTVKITMDHIRVPMGDNTLEGSSTDTFTGFISPTMDTWQAQWTAFTRYKGLTSEGKTVDLATDETYGEAQTLIFTKTPAAGQQ